MNGNSQDVGYGDIGHQNEFYDGNNWYVSQVPSGNSTTPTILIPSESIIKDSVLKLAFHQILEVDFFNRFPSRGD